MELLETCIYTCSSGEMIHLLIHCTFIDRSSGSSSGFMLVTCSHPSIYCRGLQKPHALIKKLIATGAPDHLPCGKPRTLARREECCGKPFSNAWFCVSKSLSFSRLCLHLQDPMCVSEGLLVDPGSRGPRAIFAKKRRRWSVWGSSPAPASPCAHAAGIQKYRVPSGPVPTCSLAGTLG